MIEFRKANAYIYYFKFGLQGTLLNGSSHLGEPEIHICCSGLKSVASLTQLVLHTGFFVLDVT